MPRDIIPFLNLQMGQKTGSCIMPTPIPVMAAVENDHPVCKKLNGMKMACQSWEFQFPKKAF